MTRESQSLGHAAEHEAERLLRGKGYRILERNVRSVLGEVDLVACSDDCLIFVEVKARRTTGFGGAVYAVTPRKQAKLIKLAAHYVSSRGYQNRPCRFDVVLFQGDGAHPASIQHIPNAFDVSGPDFSV